MKTRIFAVAVLALAVVTIGCAQLGPTMVSPAVYSSNRDAIVTQNELRKEKAETAKANEKLVQEMTGEWKKVAIAEIQGKSQSAGQGEQARATMDGNGVLGGFDCLFKNESPSRKKTISATKIGGFMNGQKFIIPLDKNTRIFFKLPTGYFSYTWTVENDSSVYPGDGPHGFNVTAVPKSFDLESEKNYHGGVRLFGY